MNQVNELTMQVWVAIQNRIAERKSNEDGFTAVEWAVTAAIVIAAALIIAKTITDGGTNKAKAITYGN
jgi:Flp pilus assembly pilin Flp